MAMRRSRTILIMAMIMLSILPSVRAEILVSVSCPESVYVYELFTCRVVVYNDSKTDTVLDYVMRSDKGHIVPLSEGERAELNVPALTKKVLEVNLWASDAGKDAFIFEYGYGRINRFIGQVIMVTSAPLYLDLESVSVTAGQKNSVKTRIVGKGYFVRVSLKYPPSIIGTESVDVGDVDGAKPVTIHMSPDPYAVGTHTVDAYIRFSDEKGDHVLLQKVRVSVSPSYQLIGAVIALAVALLVMAFVIRRRSGRSGS